MRHSSSQEVIVSPKKSLQLIVLIALFALVFANPGSARAWSGCGATYYVQWGDTLSQIAANCGTTVAAIRAANPGLGSWVYAGQTLVMPSGGYYCNCAPASYSSTYTVQYGDTMAKIARRFGVNYSDLLAANAYLYNPSLIYPGQVIYLPATPTYHTVQYGDTLGKIAGYYGTSVSNLLALNTWIWNPSLIYPGQVVRVW
jgi:LysM repeat protein